METKKFEYLETIREAVESADYEELDEYVEDIRERVKHDPDFAEIFAEIKSRHYGDVISLIDEFIYQDMRKDFEDVGGEEDLFDKVTGFGMGEIKGMEFGPEIPDEISFEEFHEEEFASGMEDE
jgi:hypothetical protein